MSISQIIKKFPFILSGLGLIISGGSSNLICTTPAITYGSIAIFAGSLFITSGLVSIGFGLSDFIKEKNKENQNSSNLIQFGLSIGRKVK